MLSHREAIFERLRQMVVKIAPLAAQMTFLPGQIDEAGRDGLLLAADEQIRAFVAGWKEIEKGMAAEAKTIADDYFSGAENLTGEAEG